MELKQNEVAAFQTKIMAWWKENGRDLPWRRDPSPYNVLVSEVMLQQTQVSRVIPKYNEFLETFPTIESLAKAETKHLLQVWSGLGYNRRALWLKEAARQILERGEFPRSVNELKELKGIGPYTSRSILIFAFNNDLAAVDTNIRRVLIASGFADESMKEKDLQDVANRILLKGRSRDWHNALMDYGSAVMTSSITGIAPTSKQPCYNGSSRQIRGELIRLLTQSEKVSISDLRSSLDCDVELSELERILNRLVSDGLVEQTLSGDFHIAA
ncbi:MAG: Fe-S cluster assembly protein HesB [Candidatus Thorarchaeota archaeon]|jgi:A/G-specific adenine glycosylase